MSVEVVSLGCRLNIAESEAMRALAADQDDLIIVNSCAVTHEAVRTTRQAIRKAKRARPDARVVVTGCAAQTQPEMFAAMAEVDAVVGQREKVVAASFFPSSAPLPSSRRKPGSRADGSDLATEIPAFAGMTDEVGMTNEGTLAGSAKIRVSDIMMPQPAAPREPAAFSAHARAFVEVQNGCDHRCTFCIIPFGRGGSRSVPIDTAVGRITALVDAGHEEIVLTGVDVTSYGHDLPDTPTLGALVEAILDGVPSLPRLRLSSLDSVEIDPLLFDLITGHDRLMPHLHLSLQAGDDMILKRMKRRHARADAIALVQRIKARRPHVAIGADIIAGFPTETEPMFANSLAMVADCDIVHGHIFPFSPREDTPAARMPQVDATIVKDRAARLRAATADRRARWLGSLVGTIQPVLFERNGRQGHSPAFAPVKIADDAASLTGGRIATMRIAALENGLLVGSSVA